MAQFDVFENPNVAQRAGFPYVIVLQSDQLDHLNTRLVMPLARLEPPPVNAPRRLGQSVAICGESVYLAAQLCAALPARVLRKPIASMSHDAAVFADALDAVISGV